MHNPENIFDYSKKIKYDADKKFRDPLSTEYILRGVATIRDYFTGSTGKTTDWRRLTFPTMKFSSLSVSFKFKSNNTEATFDGSCPETPYLNEYFTIGEIRLYTLHPESRKTIYTIINKVLNFPDTHVLFMFLAKDFHWFADKFRNDYKNAESANDITVLSALENFNYVFKSIRTKRDEEEAGRKYAAYLLDDVFKEDGTK